MKGSFKCMLKGTTYAVVFVGIFVMLLMAPGVTAGSLAAAAVLFLTVCIVLAAGFMLASVPGEYSANELGFTIKVLGKSRHYRCKELESVSCEYECPDRSGNAYVKLTVMTLSGNTDIYTENCGVKMHEIMNDPAGEKPQLMQLCDYVNRAKGAEV